MPQDLTLEPTISLDEIVNGYLSARELPQSKYRKIYAIAIRGFRLFLRDSLAIPITTTLEVLANNTAVLPVGALNKISVGVLNQRGEINSLTYDPILGLGESTNPNRLNQQTYHSLVDNDDLIFSLQDNLNIGYPIGGFGQLGIGSSSTVGFYNINWQTRVMVFNFHYFCPTSVQFVYLGVPCEDGDYAIHPFFQEALHAYIEWQANLMSGLGLRDRNKRDFDVSYRNARFSMQPFDSSDVFNQQRMATRMAPKG